MTRRMVPTMTISISSKQRAGADLHELAGIQTLIMWSTLISGQYANANPCIDLLRYDRCSAACSRTARYTDVGLAGLACGLQLRLTNVLAVAYFSISSFITSIYHQCTYRSTSENPAAALALRPWPDADRRVATFELSAWSVTRLLLSPHDTKHIPCKIFFHATPFRITRSVLRTRLPWTFGREANSWPVPRLISVCLYNNARTGAQISLEAFYRLSLNYLLYARYNSMASPVQTSGPWISARDRYVQDLSEEEQRMYFRASPESLLDDAITADRSHGTNSTTRKVMEKLQPFVAAIVQYGEAIDVYSSTYSLALGPIWGSVKVLLHVGS